MRVDVYPKYSRVPDDHLYNKTVVIVDVLRSVTSMIWAIKNNALKIIPTRDAAEAAAMFNSLGDEHCVLAGEINGEKPLGFSLSNSPLEYTAKNVAGKTIVMSTGNGTSAISGFMAAKNVILGAAVNRTAVAKKLIELGDDVIIVCAGSDEEISVDDLCGAGSIITALHKFAQDKNIKIEDSDMAFVCRIVYKEWKTGQIDISSTKSYKELMQKNCGEDIKFCLTQDITDVVPCYKQGVIE